jgi:hypothetical protein
VYREDVTEIAARVRELERRLESARHENERLRELLASRPNPWSRAAKVLVAFGVLLAVLGVVYVREMSRAPRVWGRGPTIPSAGTRSDVERMGF